MSGPRPSLPPVAPLPMTPAEVAARGWDAVDVVFVTGDAYVDHPSFAMAILGRVLEAEGFRVAILSQPDWHSCDTWRTFGRPRLCFAISAGNMDSMLNHYTANRKVRNDDAYSPGGEIGRRPDRATLVYCQRAREAYKGVPVIAGGVEASLRRLAHYDFWSDKVRRSVILDAKADLLVFGMGERPLVEILQRLAAGQSVHDLRDIRGVVYRLGASETEGGRRKEEGGTEEQRDRREGGGDCGDDSPPPSPIPPLPSDILLLPSYEEVYGLKAAAIAVYPMYRGLAQLVGMEVVGSPNSLSDEIDVLEKAWNNYDFFFVHFKYTDSRGEDGNFAEKSRMIEQLDAVVPRIVALRPMVLIVTGDHSTPARLASHSWHPVPTLLVAETCRPDGLPAFGEKYALHGGLGHFPGVCLMPLALAHAERLAKFGA